MAVEDVVCLCPDRYIESDIRLIMADYVAAMSADNDTMAALRKYFTGEVHQQAVEALPFTSAKKYGGPVSFTTTETYLLGAPRRPARRSLRRVRRPHRRLQRQGLPRAAACALRRLAQRRAANGGANAARAHTALEQDTRRGARDLQILRQPGRGRQGYLRRQRDGSLRGGEARRYSGARSSM